MGCGTVLRCDAPASQLLNVMCNRLGAWDKFQEGLTGCLPYPTSRF